ncbi:DeoR/GlpR family DNA-binding transcription regulator [Staphylococcus massiliensis]|uniref:DeoR/GlpR family DNA-binding transcription regulator n=1 Tax=Staphylococcus massiliensis TaxID=555791 RepID=UPI001EDD677F|nr:DeoR/GlpR family DNA-binding transcription regulator [Staphylococcus massiliensis]MCG3398675.1 DeoR/GlpR family DNA-binding transcription regulator [Staphylococcus massiliensis]MCG3401237.1 DeoR/GlpR family DNA-binding transcription regulator [Staphylococcus massiliensis]MCG3412586.1 DeoR/GlpR family DNA-binding transcription regulator [Staphylococcus massiliensis]
MYNQNERFQYIVNRVKNYHKVTVKDMALFLQVTPETIRKDFQILEDDKVITRVHGGAIPYNHTNKEKPFERKWMQQESSKNQIASYAATLIDSGDVVVIDGGTTTGRLPQYLKNLKSVTFVTNSILVCAELNKAIEQERIDGEVIMLAGKTNFEQDVVSGSMTNSLISQFVFDKAFISCGAFDALYAYEYEWEEAIVSSLMLKQSKASYLLTDYTKRDKETSYKISAIDDVDYIVTDYQFTEEFDYMKPDKWINVLGR